MGILDGIYFRKTAWEGVVVILTGGLLLSLVTSFFPLHTPSGKIPFAALILSVQLHSELTPRVSSGQMAPHPLQSLFLTLK